MKDDKDILWLKHAGHFIIILAFFYPYYELLWLSNEQLKANLNIKNKEAFVLYFIQMDRYWKSEYILNQAGFSYRSNIKICKLFKDLIIFFLFINIVHILSNFNI